MKTLLEIRDEDIVVSVLTEDENFCDILLSALARNGVSARALESDSHPPDFLNIDMRKTSDSGIDRQFENENPDIPVLWIVDRKNPTEPEGIERFPFSEILCFPFSDFELMRRFKTLQTFARLLEVDRSSRSQMVQWKRKAFTDPITGLYNYRYFRMQLRLEVRRAKRLKETVALVILDMDHFKTLNDRYGHPAGDKLLRDAGRLIRQSVRKTDILARYGGDEFVLILPSVSRDEAVKIVEKISERFRHAVFRLPEIDASCQITFSGGIAVFPDDAPDMEMLIRHADRALLNVKKMEKKQIEYENNP